MGVTQNSGGDMGKGWMGMSRRSGGGTPPRAIKNKVVTPGPAGPAGPAAPAGLG